MTSRTSASAPTPLRVVFVGAHDSAGGAARAMTRTFEMLWDRRNELGLNLTMRVIHQTIDHPGIRGGKPSRNRVEYARYFARTRFRKYFPRKKFVSNNKLLHSQALHHSGLGRELQAMHADLYVMNWLGNGTLSIPEVGRLGRRVVWQLYDMWMFSGAEHYTSEDRAVRNYSRASRPSHESGPDIDRETFRRKQRNWRHRLPVISPSTWLANESKRSVLTAKWPTHVIPYPLDTDFWTQMNRETTRSSWGVSDTEVVILFGAGGGTRFPHKGADLLLDALPEVSRLLGSEEGSPTVRLMIFGEDNSPREIGGIRVDFIGDLGDVALRDAYSAADMLIVPSRLEAFGQVATEAHSCSLPVIVFENTGLTDIVGHGETGFHARKNDSTDLARWIVELARSPELRQQFGRQAREKSVRLWTPDALAPRYAKVLRDYAESLKGKTAKSRLGPAAKSSDPGQDP